MDLTMGGDAMSEISEISTATSTRSKRLRFRPAKKQAKADSQTGGASSETSSKSLSILSLSRRSGHKHKKNLDKSMSDDGTSAAGLTSPEGIGGNENSADAAIRFSGQGVTYKGKLIGVDPVTGPRGDQMCKNAMTRLKAIVKGTGGHKRKILLSISMDGLKLLDEKSRQEISHHPIPLISYISRDTSDNRAFGFVYGSPSEGHQFIGVKTEKAAIPVMQTIADLFTFVYEQRKREKSIVKETSASSPPPQSAATAAVLSFGAKEEFSTEKVNAAWSRTEPSSRVLKSASATASPSTGSAILSLPLPPPISRMSGSMSSRTSTMNSAQSSDVLNELRSMRHVINSVRDASANNNSSHRYATWESFNEDEANNTITQFNDPMSSDASLRTNSDISGRLTSRAPGLEVTSEFPVLNQQYRNHNGQRLQNPAISLQGKILVPSPPSSPRSTSSRSGRLRRNRGIDQPNQVALPPVVSSPVFTQTAGIGNLSHQPIQPMPSHMFPSKNSSFRTGQDFDSMSDTRSSFEVNFDEVFANPGQTGRNSSSELKSTISPPAQTSTDVNDRYACFQEIQNLESFPSIFDNPSSSSDSDTFVAPVMKPHSDPNRASVSQSDIFGSSDWKSPPQTCAISFPSPLVPIPVCGSEDQDVRKDQRKDGSSEQSIVDPTLDTDASCSVSGHKSTNLKDVATSPGSPPSQLDSNTSHYQGTHKETDSWITSSQDPFSSLEAKHRPLGTVRIEQANERLVDHQERRHVSHEAERDPRSQAGTSESVLTNRVCAERRGSQGETKSRYSSPQDSASAFLPRERPPSSASSVASSARNPFAGEDFDDVRSNHSEHGLVYSSCPTAVPVSYSSQSAAASAAVTASSGHVPLSYAAHAASCHPAMLSRRYEPFPYPATPFFAPNMSHAFDAHFTKVPSASQRCHHTVHSQLHHQMPPECDCHFYHRHHDPRPGDMYQQPDLRYHYFRQMRHMYQQQQQQQQNVQPLEFGPSFEFDADFDSYASGIDPSHASQWTRESKAQDDPFSPAPDSRCLSPNNPFNPIFDMSFHPDDYKFSVPPPRPPARMIDNRRIVFDLDASPPPLPKRKVPSAQSAHNYHNSQQETTSRNLYACPPPDHNQDPAVGDSDSPPPLPLPSRKKPLSHKPLAERRVSFDTAAKPIEDPTDPFSVAHIDRRLNQVSLKHSSDRMVSSIMEGRRVDTSTPIGSVTGPELKWPSSGSVLSSIKSENDADNSSDMTVLNESSVFESSASPVGLNASGYCRLQDEAGQNKGLVTDGLRVEQDRPLPGADSSAGGKKGFFQHFGEDHTSPEERNIFRAKDPFAGDDFFAQ